MTKIYRPDPDNFHYPLLWADPASALELCAQLNFTSMKKTWLELECTFYEKKMSGGREPDIARLVPGLACRRDLADALFVEPNPHIEFLPISVDGAEWLLLNCLNPVRDYDKNRSILHRSFGTVFMVDKLIVNDFAIDDHELFTIEDSNRSTIFVTESFVSRVKHLRLKGLNFKQIGEVSYATGAASPARDT